MNNVLYYDIVWLFVVVCVRTIVCVTELFPFYVIVIVWIYFPFFLSLGIIISCMLLYCISRTRYACRIEQAAVMHLFERHCLDEYAPPYPATPDHLGNYPPADNYMLQVFLSYKSIHKYYFFLLYLKH